MASVTGHLGSSATGNTDIRSPVSLGVTLGTGICPNTKIEFLNNGSGGTYSYWRNTHSGNTVTAEIFLCDSNGNNKVKIFGLSIAGGGTNTTGKSATYTNSSKLLAGKKLYIIATGTNVDYLRFRGQTDITITTESVAYTLTMARDPTAGGTASAGSTSNTYNKKVQLSASANTGYTFKNWTKSAGTLSSTTANPTTFTMPASNATVTANFTHNTYSVGKAVSPSGGGSVTLGASSGYYNDKIKCTATASTGYTFSSWSKSSGTLSSTTTNPTTFTLPAANATVTANFTHNTYSVGKAVSPSGGGSVTLSASSGYYQTNIKLTATASTGYTFNKWTATGGTLANANNNPTTFTLPAANSTVTASFTHNTYSVSSAVSPSGGGSVTLGANSGYYNTKISISASAATGYHFVSWNASGGTITDSSATQTTFTLPASNSTVTATFAKTDYTVTTQVDPSGGGTLTASPSTAQMGDTVTLTPTPASGYQFDGYTTSVTVTNNTFTMPASNVTVTANFSVSAGPSTGTLDKSSYVGGDTATLTIVPVQQTYTHRFKLSFGTGMETDWIYVNVGTTVANFHIPAEWCLNTHGQTSVTGGTLTLETYDNGTLLGDYDITGLSYSALDNTIPRMSIWRCDADGNADTDGEYAKYSFTKPASVTTFRLVCGSASVSNPNATGDVLPGNRQVISASSNTDITLEMTYGTETFSITRDTPKVVVVKKAW